MDIFKYKAQDVNFFSSYFKVLCTKKCFELKLTAKHNNKF